MNTKKLYSITLNLSTYANSADEAMEDIGQNINFVLGYEWLDGHTVVNCPCGDVCEDCVDDVLDISDHNPNCMEPYACAASGDPCPEDEEPVVQTRG